MFVFQACSFRFHPKALTETSKTKVLQFLAKVKDSVRPALQPQYEEAWREEVESTGARGAARAGTSASTRPGTAASAAAGRSVSARPGTAASASTGPSALATAHPRAESSRSSRP